MLADVLAALADVLATLTDVLSVLTDVLIVLVDVLTVVVGLTDVLTPLLVTKGNEKINWAHNLLQMNTLHWGRPTRRPFVTYGYWI